MESRNCEGAPVDVLAVMHKAGISLTLYPTSGPKPSDQLREARAAVAELMEVSELVRDAIDNDGVSEALFDRLTSSLARCGGGK